MQYVLPLFPWLAILSAIGIRHLIIRFIVQPWSQGQRAAPVILACLLAGSVGLLSDRALWWRYEGFPARQFYPQSSYGDLFAELAGRGVSRLVIVDPGAGHPDHGGYTPLLHWHRLVWARQGLTTNHYLTDRRSPQPVASCEPDVFKGWAGRNVERIGQCAVRWR
jgi:hypothetical protein